MSSDWMSSDDEGLAGTEAIPAGRPIPADRPIPAGRAIPAGRPIPAGRAIPAGRPIPAGRAIPAGRPIPAGRAGGVQPEAIPAGRPIPAGRGDQLAGVLEPAQWGAVVSTLLFERSALLRLGARLIAADQKVPLLTIDRSTADYVESRNPLPEGSDGDAGLNPTAYKLGAVLRLSSERFGAAMDNSESIGPLLEDLAEALALRADGAFLVGTGRNEPRGIANRVDEGVHDEPLDADRLAAAREMLAELRGRADVVFRNPGWVLHPRILEDLGKIKLPNGNPLGASPLLQGDGSDGGLLLGYAFVTSEAASKNGSPAMFFSADWSEAWIAADRWLAAVDISSSTAFGTDELLVRAVTRHDFTLRRPRFFAFSSARDGDSVSESFGT
jgi:HK97 family phage major capsid protein